MSRPRHLHLIHDRDPELEKQPINWGCVVAVAASVAVWAMIVAGVVLFVF